jgi:hypothetical protein
MKQKIIIPSLIGIIILGFIYIYFQAPIETTPSDIIEKASEYVKKIVESEEPDIERDPDDKIDYEGGDIVGEGFSNEGGGEGSGESNSNQPSEITCSKHQLPYSLRRSETIETCNTYQENNCIDKTVECYIELHNGQSSVSGDYTIRTYLLDESFQEIFSTTQTKTVPPESFAAYETQSNFTDPETAQQKLTCFFNTVSVPEVEVCS